MEKRNEGTRTKSIQGGRKSLLVRTIGFQEKKGICKKKRGGCARGGGLKYAKSGKWRIWSLPLAQSLGEAACELRKEDDQKAKGNRLTGDLSLE